MQIEIGPKTLPRRPEHREMDLHAVSDRSRPVQRGRKRKTGLFHDWSPASHFRAGRSGSPISRQWPCNGLASIELRIRIDLHPHDVYDIWPANNGLVTR